MTEEPAVPIRSDEILDATWKEMTGGEGKREEWFDLAAPREMSVVSYVLSFPELLDSMPFLSSKHFLIPKLGKVWAAIADLRASGQPITMAPLTRAAGIPGRDLLMIMKAGSDFGLMAANIPFYGEEIVRSWHTLQVSSAASKAMGGANSIDMRQITEAVERAREDLSSLNDTKRPRLIGISASDILAMTDEKMTAGVHGGATTGLSDLDMMIGGLKSGGLYIIAGRPGMGKSVLAGSIARQSAKAGVGVFFGSLELADDMQTARFLADESCEIGQPPIPYEDILRGTINRQDRQRIGEAAEALSCYPLIMSDKTNITVSEIRGMVKDADRELKRMGNSVKVVVIDYLKFIRATDRYAGQRVNEVGEITGALKGMAKDMGLAVVLVCQLNRQNEQRDNKRPQLSDLRDSGDIEQDADVVMFVYRAEYYARQEADFAKREELLLQSRNILEILIEKNRHGRTDTVKTWCDVATSSVRDLEWKR